MLRLLLGSVQDQGKAKQDVQAFMDTNNKLNAALTKVVGYVELNVFDH